MLVNRDDWYQSPINELGDFRGELKPVFKEIIRLYSQLKPAENSKLTETSVSFSYAHYRCGYGRKKDPLLKALYQADLDYDFCDLTTGKRAKKILFYSGEEWLPREEQAFLQEYVDEGGTLVLFQKGPVYDEHKRPFNLLELPLPEAVLGGNEVLSHKKELEIELSRDLRPRVHSEVHVYGLVKDASSIWAKQVPSSGWELQWKLLDNTRYRIGLVLKRGKGKIILLGVLPNPELLHSLHQFLKVSRGVYSTTEGVTTSLFQRKNQKKYFMVLTNNSGKKVEAFVSLSYKIKSASPLMNPEALLSSSLAKKPANLTISLLPKSGEVLLLNA